jgi:hypothetical protein
MVGSYGIKPLSIQNLSKGSSKGGSALCCPKRHAGLPVKEGEGSSFSSQMGLVWEYPA